MLVTLKITTYVTLLTFKLIYAQNLWLISSIWQSWGITSSNDVCFFPHDGTDDPKKTEFLMALDGAKERLHLFQANLLEEGSFDALVDGCEGVFHTASPVQYSVSNPQVHFTWWSNLDIFIIQLIVIIWLLRLVILDMLTAIVMWLISY